MGWRTLTELPDIIRAHKRYSPTGKVEDADFSNQENIRVDNQGDLEVKTHMQPIKLGHMTNAEFARLQMNILGVYPPMSGIMEAQGVYKKLSETPGIDRISPSDFGKVANVLLPRIGGVGTAFGTPKGDQSWAKKYYSEKYPQVAELMYPHLKRHKELKAMGLRGLAQFNRMDRRYTR